MLARLLPENVFRCLCFYNLKGVCEIRLRTNSVIIINYNGTNIPLTKDGKTTGEKMFATKDIIDFILKRATENSLYAYNNQIKQGFITAKGGLRLGIGGESVNSDAFMPTTIKNINSINIRVPHEVKGCASAVFRFIYSKTTGLKNTLIISPPGAGKTTYLRDIARGLSLLEDKIFNVLLVDERFEIASTVDGFPMLDVGQYTDIVSGANKMFAFTNAIRSLRPDVIITDELVSVEDFEACKTASLSGVKVIASVHSAGLADLREKEGFKEVVKMNCFERYVVLSNRNGVGTCEGVFDENMKCIYF